MKENPGAAEFEWAIAPCFDFAEDFAANGLARVGMGDGENSKWEFINEKGEEVIPLRYDGVVGGFAANELAAVEVKARKSFRLLSTGHGISPMDWRPSWRMANGAASTKGARKSSRPLSAGRRISPAVWPGPR
jgi:hypothetical protein